MSTNGEDKSPMAQTTSTTQITTSSLLTGETEKSLPPDSLLSLPKEVRNRIWHFALRPDCMFLSGPNICLKSHCHRDKNIDRWKVLVLCSTIYNETVVLLRSNGELIVQLSYRGPPVFEYSLRRTNTGLYDTGEMCGIPCVREIQLRQARNVAVIVQLGLPERPDGRRSALSYEKCTAKPKLGDVLRVLRQAEDIRQLRLFIERRSSNLQTVEDWEKAFELDRNQGIHQLLLAIVREVARKGGEVIVGRAFTYLDENMYCSTDEPLESHDADPVVPWLLQAALQEGIFATRLTDPPLHRQMAWEGLRVRIEDRMPDPDGPVQRPLTYEELPDKISATPSAITFGLLESDIKDVRELTGQREMVPQCNTDCQRTLGSMKDLENHLRKFPDHRISSKEAQEAKAARLREMNEAWGDAEGWTVEEPSKDDRRIIALARSPSRDSQHTVEASWCSSTVLASEARQMGSDC
jgi:hypothetical protein